MDVILKQDVERLGAKNDIVTVKTGYARNYLIPQGFAIAATDDSRNHKRIIGSKPTANLVNTKSDVMQKPIIRLGCVLHKETMAVDIVQNIAFN